MKQASYDSDVFISASTIVDSNDLKATQTITNNTTHKYPELFY